MKLIGLAAVAAVATMLPVPALASDFSQLSEPSFARSMLLSPGRLREAQCAALARAEVRLNRSMKESDAEAIAEEILRPLTAEIGDPKFAHDMMDGERLGPRDYDDAETAKSRLADMEMIGQQCAPLFEAFRSSGVAALRAQLEPSRGLIPLLALPECVAIAEASARSGHHSPYDEGVVADLRELARQGGTAEELADREKAIAAARRLAANPEEADTLMMRAVACLATFKQHAELVHAGRPR